MKLSRRAFSFSAAASPLLLHASARGQAATPASLVFDPATVRMEGLLQYVPGGILDSRELYLVWNDFERQVAVIRENNGDVVAQESDDILAMTSLYANGPEFLMWAAMLEELAGFTMDQALQSLEFGTPPYTSLLIKLSEDPESLIPFWESVDYEERENEFGKFWTIGEDGEMDLTHPVQQKMIARLNNVAILPGNVLAYATTSELIGQMMSTAAGDRPNRLAELEPILAGLPDGATDAWLMDGTIFDQAGLLAQQPFPPEVVARFEDLLSDSDAAVGAMPVLRTACAGLTAGGSRNEEFHNPDAREFIILETDGADQAAQAADVTQWRLENLASINIGEPFNELLPNLEIEVLDGEFLRVSLPLAVPRAILSQMIFSRDTLLFAY